MSPLTQWRGMCYGLFPLPGRTTMRTLADVDNFGAVAAEDDQIKRFFVQTPVYDALIRGDKQVVLGRKGSGKSALYLALIDRADGTDFMAKGLTFSEYPWATHTRYAHELTSRHERFIASWRFLSYIEIFKLLLTQDRRRYKDSSDARAALASVEAFIKKNWGHIAFDYKKTFPSGGFKLHGLQFAPQVLGFAAGSVSVDKPGGLGQTIARLNEWLAHALLAVGQLAPTVYVLFDELDTGYDPTSADYTDRVIGLLLAVRILAREFQSHKLPFFPIALLRTDIFSNLQFGDRNKLIEKNSITLSWNDDLGRYHGSSLKQLIDHRIRRSLDLPESVSDPWSRAFDSGVMRGTQHKFQHMTFRSFMRPRDIIRFANSALESFKHRTGGKVVTLISNADIKDARRAYSEYLREELGDEIPPSIPDWKDYLNVLRRIGWTRFNREQFDQAYNFVKRRQQLSMTADEVLYFFYEYSIIGFQRAAGAVGLVQHFRYQDETVRFNPDAKEFTVHRGLKEALELREVGSMVDDDDEG
jgi:hypothetical protein